MNKGREDVTAGGGRTTTAPKPGGIAARLDPMRLQTMGLRGLFDEMLGALDNTLVAGNYGTNGQPILFGIGTAAQGQQVSSARFDAQGNLLSGWSPVAPGAFTSLAVGNFGSWRIRSSWRWSGSGCTAAIS